MGEHQFKLAEAGLRGFKSAAATAASWAKDHGWETGVAEMALGGAMLAWGIESGAIELGQQLVASFLEDGVTEGMLGGGVGATLGVLPGLIVKSIGIAAMGTAVSVPALVLMGGGALVMGLAGYGAGRLVADYLHQAPALAELIGAGSLALVGTALLLDGARRIVKDPDVRQAASRFSDGVLRLVEVSGQQLLSSKDALFKHLDGEIRSYVAALQRNPRGAMATVSGVGVGAAAGGALAASSVTVLGSSSLGGVALSLGLVSAPLWPVLAGAGGALIASYGAWKFMQKRKRGALGDLGIGCFEPLRLTYVEPDDA